MYKPSSGNGYGSEVEDAIFLPFGELKGYRSAGYDWVGHCGTNGSNIYEFWLSAGCFFLFALSVLVHSCQSFILVQVPECAACNEQVRFKKNQTNKQNTLHNHYCVSTELRAANLLNKGFLFMYAMCIRVWPCLT